MATQTITSVLSLSPGLMGSMMGLATAGVNSIVTNMPGPQFALYQCGAKKKAPAKKKAAVKARPDKPALVCEQRRLSYAELDQRANRLANYWQSLGIGKGDHIGLQLCNGSSVSAHFLANDDGSRAQA